MNRVSTILENFLIENERLSKTKAGADEPRIISQESKDHLIKNLIKESHFNRSLIVVILGMFVIMFGIGIYFALYYRDEPKTMGAIFGGSFFSLLIIIKGLHSVWRQKSTVDMLLTIVPSMTPDKAIEIIEILYYSAKKKSN